MADKEKPEVIEDKDLEDTSGGIGLLLPAIQKIREAGGSGGAGHPPPPPPPPPKK